jgi:hypothetical protein
MLLVNGFGAVAVMMTRTTFADLRMASDGLTRDGYPGGMNMRSLTSVRRLLILLFAAISMFGCVAGSAVAHTADAMATAMGQ